MVFWHESAIKKASDLVAMPSIAAVSSLNDIFAARYIVMNRLIGAKIRLLGGYHSARDYVLAARRGEADGFWIPFITLKQSYADDLANKKLNVVLQSGLSRLSHLPDVPTMLELSDDPKAKQIFRYLVSNDEIGRSLFTTPGVPPMRMQLLQSAFHKMLEDSAFKEEAKKRGLPLSPRPGNEIQKLVLDTFDASPDVVNEVRKLTKH
jgi:hypothetical protein